MTHPTVPNTKRQRPGDADGRRARPAPTRTNRSSDPSRRHDGVLDDDCGPHGVEPACTGDEHGGEGGKWEEGHQQAEVGREGLGPVGMDGAVLRARS